MKGVIWTDSTQASTWNDGRSQKLADKSYDTLQDDFMRMMVCKMVHIVTRESIKGIGVIKIYR